MVEHNCDNHSYKESEVCICKECFKAAEDEAYEKGYKAGLEDAK